MRKTKCTLWTKFSQVKKKTIYQKSKEKDKQGFRCECKNVIQSLEVEVHVRNSELFIRLCIIIVGDDTSIKS